MEFIDTHAHIYLEHFKGDIDHVVNTAYTSHIKEIYLPNIDNTTIADMLDIEKRHSTICKSMMGIHPCSIKEDFENELRIAEQWLSKRNFAGIGETGTDLYWDKTFIDKQIESLRIHIDWAKRYKLPIILHSRDSLDTTIDIIEKNHSQGLSGIFHCFNGNIQQAKRIIELGFFLGIGGVITFKNANVDAVIKEVAPEHLVLETDSPYLAPVPHRGKRNEPSYIPAIAEKLAMIYDLSINNIAKITTENARKVFKNK